MSLNTFKVATRALLVNKSRTFLTTLGIIIGVFSVVMLTGLGSGLQAYVSDQFEGLGANTVLYQSAKFLMARVVLIGVVWVRFYQAINLL
jgi:ABC-type antimicrobial peptide transport system permease subunit